MAAAKAALKGQLAPGTPVWARPGAATEEWVEAEVVSEDGADQVTVQLVADQKTVAVPRARVKAMDVSSHKGVDDMTKLADLFEGSLLRNLRLRFQADQIYTYTGTILVAVNPYKPIPELYSQDALKRYERAPLGSQPPHVFALVENAYRHTDFGRLHKSLLISGESGAGKTETTKLILNFLTHLSGAHSSVEQLILESSPILEAFGNATTTANDNSSRFGKYVEVFLTTSGKIIGGRITEYLLEKSRIVRLSAGDRNYHIFYAFLHGATAEEKASLQLRPPEQYVYLKQSKSFGDPAASARKLAEIKFALNVIGFSDEEQSDIARILAAILHLGNITFVDSGQDVATVSDKQLLALVAKLLQVPDDMLDRALTTQGLRMGRDNVDRLMPVPLCDATRDSLAKALYGRLFRWLVGKINAAMAIRPDDTDDDSGSDTEGPSAPRAAPPPPPPPGQLPPNVRSIGVLDIFGFEVMEVNSFEQFCINLANEALQKYFNDHIFRMEQADYAREGIQWSPVTYTDNEDCLKLLYKDKLSLMSLLDDESSFPGATDETLITKFHQWHSTNPGYEKSARNKMNFAVQHYAGKVVYTAQQFLEKNSDVLNDTVLDLFARTKNARLASWFAAELQASSIRSTIKRGYRPPTVGGQFKDSLNQLMVKLEKTDPYFIRCIKPNKVQAPGRFESSLVLAQLRYTGMVETIRIRALGYSLRVSFDAFYAQYGLAHRFFACMPAKAVATDAPVRDKCQAILDAAKLGPPDCQLGKTMVFLKPGPQKVLEERRAAVLLAAGRKLISFIKMVVIRRQFLRTREATVILQRWMRSQISHRHWQGRRRAVIWLQKSMRVRRESTLKTRSFRYVAPVFRAARASYQLADLKAAADRIRENEKAEQARQRELEAALRQLEEEKRRALLLNPGFAVIGLRQETEAKLPGPAFHAAMRVPDLVLPAISPDMTWTEQFAFGKYAALYLRPDISMAYSAGGLHSKLAPVETNSALAIHRAINEFVALATAAAVPRDGSAPPPIDVAAWRCVDTFWQMASATPRLTDEAFCQLVRHTWYNGNKESCLAGWQLLALAAGSLAPSATLLPYLAAYVEERGPEGYASYCLRLLRRAQGSAARRERAPTSLEIGAVLARTPVLLPVAHLKDPLALDAWATSDDAALAFAALYPLSDGQGFGLRVNGRELFGTASVFDAVSDLERAGSPWTAEIRRIVWRPQDNRTYADVNEFVAEQITNDVMQGKVDIGKADALMFALLRFLATGGTRHAIATLDFDPQSKKNPLLPVNLLALQDTATWAREFLTAYDIMTQKDKPDTFRVNTLLISLAETWPTYFGASWPIQPLDGLPTPKVGEQLYILANINGLAVFKYVDGAQTVVQPLPYSELVGLSSTERSLTLSLTNNRHFTFDTRGTDVRAAIDEYLRDLKAKAKYCVSVRGAPSVQPHEVSDPLLLNFASGTIIRLLVSPEPLAAGWLYGECNDVPGMFPEAFVERLFGADPPTSKETLLFQATCLYEEAGERRLQLLDALTQPDKHTGRIPKSLSMQLDDKFYFVEYAKKYFNPSKRGKSLINVKSAIHSIRRRDVEHRGSLTGKRFGSIRFDKHRPNDPFVIDDRSHETAGLSLVNGERGITTEDISFSPDPLRQPLLASTTGRKQVRQALALSLNILKCMGDYPSKRTWREYATAIIQEGITNEDLRDELLCQVVKQVINNQRSESLLRGWYLLNLCVGSITPSEQLFPYLRQFLLRTVALDTTHPFYEVAVDAQAKLERTRLNGVRRYPPIPIEIDSVERKMPIALRVYFPDASSRSLIMDSATTAGELVRQIGRKLDADAQLWTGFGIYIETDDFQKSIPSKTHLFDAMAEAGIQPTNCRLVFKKRLWLPREDFSSDAFTSLVYHQLLPTYLRGVLRCPVEDPEERMQEVAFLAALQYKASGEDQRRNTNHAEIFRGYIPEYLYTQKPKEEWTRVVLSAFTSLLNGKTQSDAKAIFVDSLRKWPLFGSAHFTVRQTMDPTMPAEMLMYLNAKGIALVNPATREPRMFFKISEIASWMYGPKHFSMKIKDVQSGDKLIFFTTAGEEINDLLEDYIQALMEHRQKSRFGTVSSVAHLGRTAGTLNGPPDHPTLPPPKRAPAITGQKA